MNAKIEVLSFSRDTKDYRGKDQKIVYHCLIGGREKAVGKADLIRAIEMNLPQRDEEEATRTPTFPAMAEGNGR